MRYVPWLRSSIIKSKAPNHSFRHLSASGGEADKWRGLLTTGAVKSRSIRALGIMETTMSYPSSLPQFDTPVVNKIK